MCGLEAVTFNLATAFAKGHSISMGSDLPSKSKQQKLMKQIISNNIKNTKLCCLRTIFSILSDSESKLYANCDNG